MFVSRAISGGCHPALPSLGQAPILVMCCSCFGAYVLFLAIVLRSCSFAFHLYSELFSAYCSFPFSIYNLSLMFSLSPLVSEL